jgi:DNA-binding MarR family transcriptional regulator
LGRTVKLIEHCVDEMLAKKGFNLTKMQFILLHNVHEQNGACQNDLAYASNRNKSSLTRAINVLEKKNYIARIPCQEDKRMNQLYITKTGMDVLERSAPFFDEMRAIIHNGISDQEANQVIEILERIRRNVENELQLNTPSNKEQ